MKILIVSGAFFSKYKAWPDYLLATGLKEAGCKVSGLAHRNPVSTDMSLRRRKDDLEGIPVRRIKPHHHGISPGIIYHFLMRERPDIVHIDTMKNRLSLLTAIMCRCLKIPMVMTLHGILHDDYITSNINNPYKSKIDYENLIFNIKGIFNTTMQEGHFSRNYINYRIHGPLKKCDMLVALSNHEKGILNNIGINETKVEVIPNGIDTMVINKFLYSKDNVRSIGHGGPLIVYVGQLKKRKGFDLLAESMPVVVKKHKNASFVFISHNLTNKTWLEEIIKKHGVEKNYTLLDNVDDPEKYKIMAMADCLVLPSRYEGFGIPIIEGMAAGCPVISSNIPVIDEIIQNEWNGLLAPLDDPEALGEAILRVVEDRVLKTTMIKNGLDTVKKR